MRSIRFHRSTTYARLLAALAVAALTLSAPVVRAQDPGYNDSQQADPPSVVGRVSILQGNVSMQSVGQDFSAAELNYPLTNGDRLYTDNAARGEIEVGQLSIRLGQQTDFTVTALNDQFAQFGLGQGSVHLRTFSLDPGTTTELDTPNASITLLQPGDTRVDVFPQDNVTVVTVLSGQAQVNADGVQQVVQPGQSLQISGSNPSRAQLVGRPRPDDLDRFSGQRDVFFQRAVSTEGSYVSPDTIGADDLVGYGDWDSSADYGPVWYPRNVAVDWSPYSDGHWANIAPWGWTWVGAEPWGFAPYHYGRWNRFGNRWGWVPGPRVVRPVYSPALVAFVGGGSSFSGGGFSVSIGGGGGVAAWFPLGPREVYRPWYRSSPGYVNRVNVTNIYNRNPVEVRNIYNRHDNAYPDNHPAAYVNRSVATIAVPQRSFGSGRSMREVAIRGDQRQFQNAPVMNRPPVAAEQRDARPPARALPPRMDRPAFDARGNGDRNAQGGRGYYGGGRQGDRQGQPQGQQGFQPGSQPAPQPGYRLDRNNNPQPTNSQPAEAGRPGNNQPGQPNQPARDGNPANGYGNGGRFGGNRNAPPVTQPAPVTQPTPSTQPTQPVRDGNPANGDRFGNGGRFGGNRNAPPAAQPAPATQPAPVVQPAQPVRDGNPANGDRFGNGGRFGGNRNAPPAAQPAPATQPAPVAQPAPTAQPTQPVRDGNPGNFDRFGGAGRFGGNRNAPAAAQPAQPYTPPAPQPVQPERQRPAPVAQPAAPSGQNDFARPGPRREAPDAPIRMEPRPQPPQQQQQAAPQPRPQPPQQAAPQRQQGQPERQPPVPPRPVTPSDDKKKE
jgi:hypothetical protein